MGGASSCGGYFTETVMQGCVTVLRWFFGMRILGMMEGASHFFVKIFCKWGLIFIRNARNAQVKDK